MPPDQGLANKKSSGVKGRKVRLTYVLTSNADGSEKLPPLIIGKAKKPRAFRNQMGAQLGFYYRNNAKAWMTTTLYQEWIQQWDHDLGVKNRKILLLQDNFSGHIVPHGLRNIQVENFQPNLTAHVQPMDQGIIRCFKAHYRARYIRRAIDIYDGGVTASEIYDINQLQAMRLADIAWCDVDTTTIRHCWRKAGILPTTDSPSVLAQPIIPISSLCNIDVTDLNQDPAANAENEVRNALNNLQATGVLRPRNRMDIEALLNPPEESWIMEETRDEEICQAVLAARNVQEEGPINGGDDDVEDDSPLEPYPTHREVFQAASIINRYIEHLDNPLARKLEAILASFGRQIHSEESRSMSSTHLTDYFTRT